LFLYCIVLYLSIYIAPLNNHEPIEALLFGSMNSKKRDKF